MSFKHGLLLLSLFCGYHANIFPVDHDPSSFSVDPAARPIVGGEVAPPGSAPHMVALLEQGSFICGGSLISSRTVLTAAHCLPGPGRVSSYTGKVGTNLLDKGGSIINFEKAIVHPGYKLIPVIKNDVGLLITTEPVQISALVKPVTLSYQHVGGGVEVKATGWGEIKFPDQPNNELLQLLMKTVDTPECQKHFKMDPSMMCALHSVNHGMCRGDSGSALVRTDSGEQVGIVSYGEPCAKGVPDVFSRVSAFENFIETNKVQYSYTGKVGTNLLDKGGSIINFEKAIVHPGYKLIPVIKNDVGLLITTEPVQISALVKPVTLSYQHVGGGVEVKATGWGEIKFPDQPNNELLQLLMTTVDTPECQKHFKMDPVSMMCALHSVNHGMCRGDSGSALERTDSGEQVGIVSYGRPCAKGVPDVFSRVSAFENFIETNKVQ